MNFRAVSGGQKRVYEHGSVAAGFSGTGGYTDPIGTPSASLLREIEFVDGAIGRMGSELESRSLLESTLIVISAKHGQSPIAPARPERSSRDRPAGQSPAPLPARLPPGSRSARRRMTSRCSGGPIRVRPPPPSRC